MKAIRCAIYTRKSSDEGLEQSFNSLDAQREACSAYILSQASEGWTEVREQYDDGGLSGGTLERPALQCMLADIAAGRIDIVVVYKVDRLTRSLLDFAKLVEAFDKAGTSFVSITQSFNTTSSMGRLTLNMLLSFAQFEREVTAERIRDKIAASKAKGMWMGGIPPLGYRPDGRTLAIVEEHAAIVREIFERYRVVGNVRLLQDSLERDRIFMPERTTTRGKSHGGQAPTRGQLYRILTSRIYIGQIEHREKHYPGLHPPIIARNLWEQVQEQLTLNLQGERARSRASQPSPLAGKITDSEGQPLIADHACKGKRRYRYYVSQASKHGGASGLRIPAKEIEGAVQSRLAQLFDDRLGFLDMLELDVDLTSLPRLETNCRRVASTLRSRDVGLVERLTTAVRVFDRAIEIDCATDAIAAELGIKRGQAAHPTITLSMDVRLTRSGHVMRLVQSNGAAVERDPATSLIKPILQGRRWWAELRLGQTDVTAIARREGLCTSYVSRIVRLAFLSPAVVEAMLAGRQRDGVDRAMICAPGGVPADWQEQKRLMLADG